MANATVHSIVGAFHASPTRAQARPTPSPIDLARIVDVRREMARIYREMKAGQMEATTGAKLVWVLSQIGSMIELEEFERRITELEDRQRLGTQRALPAAATTH